MVGNFSRLDMSQNIRPAENQWTVCSIFTSRRALSVVVGYKTAVSLNAYMLNNELRIQP